MTRTVRILSLLAAAAVTASVPAADAAKKKKVQCVKRGGDTIYRDSSLRVIQSVKTSKSDPDASTAKFSFCRPGSTAAPKTFLTLVRDLDGGLFFRAAVRGGNHLGLEFDEQTGTTDATNFFVYDLTTRKRTFSHASENEFAYVLTDGGGVALLEAGNVTGFDSAGQRALGTSGGALASSGNVVYWFAGNAPQAALLNGAASRVS